MPVPPAPLQRHAQDRADSRPPGRVVRWALRVLLITVALLGTASPALAAVHSVGGSPPRPGPRTPRTPRPAPPGRPS